MLDTVPLGQLTFLITEYGRPFTPSGFGNWFRDRCDEAKVPGSAHGLRKAAASMMAQNSASPHEIAAVTGHQTLKEIENYTRAASRKKMADAEVSRIKA